MRVPRAPYGASTASVRARTRNGTVVELLLEDPGAGYVQKDGVTPSKANILKIAPPAGAPRSGRAARAAAAGVRADRRRSRRRRRWVLCKRATDGYCERR